MLLNASRLIVKVRRHVVDVSGQQQGNTWTDADILDYLDETQESLVQDVLGASEDYFGAMQAVDFIQDQGSYDLWPGFLYLRILEFNLGQNGDSVDYQQAIESRMIEGVLGAGGVASRTDSQFYYSLYGDQVHVDPVPSQTMAGAGQAWFIREPGNFLFEIPSSLPAADELVLDSGNAPWESDILIGSFVDVVSGTGAGQRKKITAWDGPNRKATVDSPFSPELGATSKVATVSRLPRLFHGLLNLGAALRMLSDEKEDAAQLASLYNDLHEKFVDHVETRTYGQRGVVPYDPDD